MSKNGNFSKLHRRSEQKSYYEVEYLDEVDAETIERNKKVLRWLEFLPNNNEWCNVNEKDQMMCYANQSKGTQLFPPKDNNLPRRKLKSLFTNQSLNGDNVGVVKSENKTSIETLDKKEQAKPKVMRRRQVPKPSENSSKAAVKPGDQDLTREKLKKTPIVLKKHSYNTRFSVLNKKVEKKLDLITKMPLNIYTRTRGAWKRRQAEPPNGPKAKKPRREDPA